MFYYSCERDQTIFNEMHANEKMPVFRQIIVRAAIFPKKLMEGKVEETRKKGGGRGNLVYWPRMPQEMKDHV